MKVWDWPNFPRQLTYDCTETNAQLLPANSS